MSLSDFDVSALLSSQHLTTLEAAFASAPNGTLDLTAFAFALTSVLGPGRLPDDQLRRLFERIDANSDGHVEWKEWCHFFLILDQRSINLERDANRAELRPSLEVVSSTAHDSPIFRLALTRLTRRLAHSNYLRTDSVYVSCTHAGVVCLWKASTLTCLYMYEDLRGSYVTDMCVFSFNGGAYAAMSRVDRSIQVVALTTGAIVLSLPHLGDTAMCLTMYEHAHACRLVFGDMAGRLHITPILPCYTASLTEHLAVHTDWVTKVVFEPTLHALLTASVDGAIHCIRVPDHTLLQSFTQHRGGVYALLSVPTLTFVASSGAGNDICLWEPVSTNVLATLAGHAAPVYEMTVNAAAGKLFSLAKDKTIKVWDCYSYECTQTIVDANLYFPHDLVECILWDCDLQHLVSTTTQLRVWPTDMVLKHTVRHRRSHDVAITCAAYSALLHQVASADVNSVVNTWDAATGKLVLRMPRAHDNERITAMSYDRRGKRLITGAADGSVRIWNGSNGQLLSQWHHADACSVVALLFAQPILHTTSLNTSCFVLVAGDDSQVRFFEDTKALNIAPSMTWPDADDNQQRGHAEVITAMCWLPAKVGLVVSASLDGTICIWSLHTRRTQDRLHLSYARVDQCPDAVPSSPVLCEHAVSVVSHPLINGFVTGGNDGRIDFWSTKLATIRHSIFASLEGHAEAIASLAIDVSGSLLLAGYAHGVLQVHSIYDVPKHFTTAGSPPLGIPRFLHAREQHWVAHHASVVFVAFAKTMVVSAAKDGRVLLSSWQGGLVLSTFGHDTLPVALDAPQNLSVTSEATSEDKPPALLQRTKARRLPHPPPSETPRRPQPSTMLSRPSVVKCQRVLSPREASLAASNQLTLHAITIVPETLERIVHKRHREVARDPDGCH
ncbi:hypothetical protein SDRG_08007 [Saprolegnia diclina VS20]|uniref:EF-hand domain-containing protein n=1 Tax=Saprolegnia diclina (strain VS20) TaxID=1156394 RepID=T0QLK7_SAPDV|nr:hypothetical protein SDRG_08007 [Saprolegnia diclina VS20]EQC34690.1 hypothetical protein SDRG_08007 [Saprolegnia diclina VS20]|eukprot:XP_008612096.1 hypothetical protein SDRG_08007 [Saprolegnia diclina VS20]